VYQENRHPKKQILAPPLPLRLSAGRAWVVSARVSFGRGIMEKDAVDTWPEGLEQFKRSDDILWPLIDAGARWNIQRRFRESGQPQCREAVSNSYQWRRAANASIKTHRDRTVRAVLIDVEFYPRKQPDRFAADLTLASLLCNVM